MSGTTTIRISTTVKKELDELKNFEKESYEDVIERLVNTAKEDQELDAEEIKQIEKSLEDLKKGRAIPYKEAKKKWGL